MSGTSLDGLDVAYCEFTSNAHKWHYSIKAAQTFHYGDYWVERLKSAITLDGLALKALDNELGKWMAERTSNFITSNNIQADFIASHGHTVFHQPKQGITLQIGSAHEIHATTKLPVVYDFRTLDVSFGGQGAPMVPVGDHFLFSDYISCLNLGGIANFSFLKNRNRVAYDIVPVNILFNHLSRKVGEPFDKGGDLARVGSINSNLINQLNCLEYYNKTPPKTLGLEWVSENILSILDTSSLSISDLLATCVEHVAMQISTSLPKGEVLITGGGTHNDYLMERIEKQIDVGTKLHIPDKTTIDYKEALIFAFLGVFRIRGENNCFCSVTGATQDSCNGSIIGNMKYEI